MESVTVVMSSYNGEKYILEQIDSILGQKNCQVSLIVRDDGSTDNTVKILREYEDQGKLKIIQGENLKPAKSFLEALRYTEETSYYAFSDQDDIWMEDKLSVAIEKLESLNKSLPNLYCSNLTTVNNDHNVLIERLLPEHIVSDYRELLVRSPHIFGCTCVFNFELRNFIVRRQTPNKLIMHDLWLALIASAIGTLYYDKSSYILYRQHGDNHTGAIVSEKEKMKSRWAVISNSTPFLISPQAEEFISYVGEDKLKEAGVLEYTQIVANYKKSIRDKVRYLSTVRHDNMNWKQYAFHVLMILLNKL